MEGFSSHQGTGDGGGCIFGRHDGEGGGFGFNAIQTTGSLWLCRDRFGTMFGISSSDVTVLDRRAVAFCAKRDGRRTDNKTVACVTLTSPGLVAAAAVGSTLASLVVHLTGRIGEEYEVQSASTAASPPPTAIEDSDHRHDVSSAQVCAVACHNPSGIW